MSVLGSRSNLRPLPLQGGGWEGVIQSRRFNGMEDGVEHAIEILPDLRVPETEHTKPAGCEPGVAPAILCSTLIEAMRFAIELDDDAERWAVEVEDVGTHRMLSSEANAIHLG